MTLHPFDEGHLTALRERFLALEYHSTGAQALAKTSPRLWRVGEIDRSPFGGALRQILSAEGSSLRFSAVSYFRGFVVVNPVLDDCDGDGDVVVRLSLSDGRVDLYPPSTPPISQPDLAVFWHITLG